MPESKIHIIGNDDLVLLLGLLGIEGTILSNPEQFLLKFNELIKDSSIGMIIISMNLPEEILDYLIDFKSNNRRPLVFLLPDIFQTDIESNDIFMNIIRNSIGKIIN